MPMKANQLVRLSKSPYFTVVALGIAAAVLINTLRGSGFLEPLELMAYDHYLRATTASRTPRDRVVLVGATDADLDRWGWPLSDRLLARALEKLLAHSPAAIGIDLYRDAPRGEGETEFRQVMLGNPHIIAVTKIGGAGSTGIPPPAFLPPERVGFADVLLDRADIVRRGLLFVDDGERIFTGFALRLALPYLQQQGTGIRPDPADPARLMLGNQSISPMEADDGGYAGIDARGYQVLLDYAGGVQPFRRLTLTEVLEDRIPIGTVTGRVVILGVTAQSVKDFFATPLDNKDGEPVFGIELHGHAVDQLLRIGLDGNAPLTASRQYPETAWLFLWGLLGALTSQWLRNPWHLGLAFCGGLAIIYGAGLAAMARYFWLPSAAPALAWAMACLLTVTYLSALERRQRTQLMQLFARHVSSEVANEIWKHHEEFLSGEGRPLPQNLQVTVLFSDIRGFTSVSERMSPEDLMMWLNEYTGAMADLVIAHGGMVDKFIGDAVMAIFGAPVPHHDRIEQDSDAVRAVRCALTMETAIARLNADWQSRVLPAIAVRIGINSGEVVAGSLGSKNRLEYTIIGDAVNTAARLESLDKDWPGLEGGEACRILVSSSTMARLDDHFEAVGIGSTRLKGKEHPTDVYRIVRPRPNRT